MLKKQLLMRKKQLKKQLALRNKRLLRLNPNNLYTDKVSHACLKTFSDRHFVFCLMFTDIAVFSNGRGLIRLEWRGR